MQCQVLFSHTQKIIGKYFKMSSAINTGIWHFTTYSLGEFSRWQTDDIFCILPRKQTLLFHANCLPRRQFAWNFKACFLSEISKIFQNDVCWNFYPACIALLVNIYQSSKNPRHSACTSKLHRLIRNLANTVSKCAGMSGSPLALRKAYKYYIFT